VVAVLLVAVVLDAILTVHRIPSMRLDLPGSGAGRTYLLVGSDSRQRLSDHHVQDYADRKQAEGERADLLLLLRVPEDAAPSLASVPRDLYVGQAAGQPRRLGLALQDGVQELVTSLCRDLAVGVDHVVLVDFEGLIDLVDAVGGVSVTTKTAVRDPRARLTLPRPGRHHLDGEAALAWVRSRHPEIPAGDHWVPDPAADRTRTTHAIDVLSQVADRAGGDLPALQRSAWTVGPHLRRDDLLGMVGLARLAIGLRDALEEQRIGTVPARQSTTDVPFAFVTDETERALAPYRSSTCR
jgi:LCP family protein required for cell wall assembly